MNQPEYTAPPDAFDQIKQHIRQHPQVSKVGVVLTDGHQWALKVWVHHGTPTPLPDVEAVCEGYPTVYADEPAQPPLARPAFPQAGE